MRLVVSRRARRDGGVLVDRRVGVRRSGSASVDVPDLTPSPRDDDLQRMVVVGTVALFERIRSWRRGRSGFEGV
jgi:hypothetical protein